MKGRASLPGPSTRGSIDRVPEVTGGSGSTEPPWPGPDCPPSPPGQRPGPPEPFYTCLSPGLGSPLLNLSLPLLAPFMTPPTWVTAHSSCPAGRIRATEASPQHVAPPNHPVPVPCSPLSSPVTALHLQALCWPPPDTKGPFSHF